MKDEVVALTLDEVQRCANDTLFYFLETMPDVPFTHSEIIIEYVKKKGMARRARELCAIYVPDKIINESQAKQLNTSIAANALIGKEKSAVLVCSDYRATDEEWRMLFFHEFMHIFCAKTEMVGDHFIDIYGSGTTPDVDPDNKIYDGYITAGYKVWSEFIAQYYALSKACNDSYDFPDVADFVNELLSEVSVATNELSSSSFAMACSYLLTCDDVGEILNPPSELNDSADKAPYEKENRSALLNCLSYLYEHLQNEKPWKISEDFIENLGGKYIMFKTINSVFLGHMGSNQ